MKKDTGDLKLTCSVTNLAKLLILSTRRVQSLVQEGILPKPEKPGAYDWLACTHAYIEYLKNMTSSRSKLDDRLKEIKIEKERFNLNKEKGLYVLWEQVDQELVNRVVMFKRDLKSIENHLSKYPEAREIVRKGHYNLMLKYSAKTGVFREKK